MPSPRFLIGIDLGTTNCAVAAVDTRRRHPRVEVFHVPQLAAPGVVEPRPVLPSFLYFPEPDEIAGGGIALPWDPHPDVIVGVMARDRGALAPARQVVSAKSWLAHPGADGIHSPGPVTVGNHPRELDVLAARALAALHVRWIEARGRDLHAHLALRRLRIGHLADRQHFARLAVAFVPGRFHFNAPLHSLSSSAKDLPYALSYDVS